MPSLPFNTPRLILRRFTESDAELFCAYRNDPEIGRYQSWSGCIAAEAAEFVHCHQNREFSEPGAWLQIAIAHRTTNELMGGCAVRIHADDARQATIGITLARAHHGQGFASEALSCLFDHLFRHLALHRVVADTDAENTAMQKLAERLGMWREGHLRQSLWFKGRWADEFLYAIRRDEWLARRASGPGPI